MLHTKPKGHWPFGSREEDFLRVFTIYGRGGPLGHMTQTPRTKFFNNPRSTFSGITTLRLIEPLNKLQL